MGKQEAHICPPDGKDVRGCAGKCGECDEHLQLTGRNTSFCPSCNVCSVCDCPQVDGFSHYAGCSESEDDSDAHVADPDTLHDDN